MGLYLSDIAALWPRTLSWLEITYTHPDWSALSCPEDLAALRALRALRKLTLVTPHEEGVTPEALSALTQLRLLSISPSPTLCAPGALHGLVSPAAAAAAAAGTSISITGTAGQAAGSAAAPGMAAPAHGFMVGGSRVEGTGAAQGLGPLGPATRSTGFQWLAGLEIKLYSDVEHHAELVRGWLWVHLHAWLHSTVLVNGTGCMYRLLHLRAESAPSLLLSVFHNLALSHHARSCTQVAEAPALHGMLQEALPMTDVLLLVDDDYVDDEYLGSYEKDTGAAAAGGEGADAGGFEGEVGGQGPDGLVDVHIA